MKDKLTTIPITESAKDTIASLRQDFGVTERVVVQALLDIIANNRKNFEKYVADFKSTYIPTEEDVKIVAKIARKKARKAKEKNDPKSVPEKKKRIVMPVKNEIPGYVRGAFIEWIAPPEYFDTSDNG